MLSLGAAAIAQTPTSDQLDQLKQNLTPEQQQAILQGVMGKSDTSVTKTDQRLNMPNTVQPREGDRTGYDLYNNKPRKTADGRILRQPNEDPELRADDTVLIELTPLYPLENGIVPNGQYNAGNNANNPNNGNNGNNWQSRQ